MLKKIATITGIIVSIGVIAGFIFQHDQSLARASDLLKVRAEITILYKQYEDDKKTSRATTVQERIWTLDERFIEKPMPQSVKEEYRRLVVELNKLRLAGY
jgi:hypothetical protein